MSRDFFGRFNHMQSVSSLFTYAIVFFSMTFIQMSAHAAETQAYPSRPVRLVVPFSPGPGLDVIGRAMAQKLSERWGRPMVVDNRGGAAGTLGADIVSKSAPDGYTLLIAGIGSLGTSKGMYPKLPYDPVRDFSPVMLIGRAQSALLVANSLPVSNVKQLIAYAKANPGQLNYSSAGSGSTGHLSMETLRHLAGIDIVHIPHKGTVQGLTAMVTGEVQLSIQSFITAAPLIKSGRIRMISSTGTKRMVEMPNMPTVSEDLPGYEFYVWYGVVAPAGTPASLLGHINREIRQVFQAQDLRDILLSQGSEIILSNEDEFRAFLAKEVMTWTAVIRRLGIREE